MKSIKKCLAILLALTLVLGLTSVTALAENSANISAVVSSEAVNVDDTFTVTVKTKTMTVATFIGGVNFDPNVVQYVSHVGSNGAEKVKLVDNEGDSHTLTVGVGESGNAFGLLMTGTEEKQYSANDELVVITFKAIAAGDAGISLYEDSDGTDGYIADPISAGFTVTVSDPTPTEGYITYNGEKLYDSVIASCLNENGDAPLADVLTAANITPTGNCFYTFTSADGYSATLDADWLEYMVLFDNDGDATNGSYSWRNSLTAEKAAEITGGWYKVTGLATIVTGDHKFDSATHVCTNPISVAKNTTEPCGEAEGFITYNGEPLYDAVIASCLNENGDAPLADVLAAAGVTVSGNCFYTFTSADGYTATLDADWLEYMVLFDNDGDPDNDSYSWRNSLTAEKANEIQGKWYKVTGLAAIVTGDHAYDGATHVCTNPISVSKTGTEPCGEEEGYITYNGEKLYDSVIASCLDGNGDAPLADVLAAAGVAVTGNCFYRFTSADGYSIALDADWLEYMVLFDNDGDATNGSYSWRNSLTAEKANEIQGKWYKVTGLATIVTGDHVYDGATHVCTNPINVSKTGTEPCGEEEGYITYNGEKLYDSVIASCLDGNGDAPLADVLAAAGVTVTGNCFYRFTSADGYSIALDADWLEYMVLFDNDGDPDNGSYSWRNSLTAEKANEIQGKWYKVTGLAMIVTGDHVYDGATHVCTNPINVSKTGTEPCGEEEGYLTYNGEKLYDSVIASCLDDNGNAPLTEVLAAAGIEATGNCFYTFTSADGYTATLDADWLEYMVLFDNDGDPDNDSYSWRNSLTAEKASEITGGWYKVTGLATIVTGDHSYDAATHVCTNQLSVSRGKYEPCGEEEPCTVGAFTWTETEDGFTATLAVTYECGETVNIDAAVTNVTTEPTCIEAGKIVYTAAVTFRGQEYKEDKTVDLEPTGHKYGEPEWTWAEDYSKATATFTCANNAEHVETVAATITSERTEPTFEAEGKIVYTAKVTFGEVEYKDEKTVVLDKLEYTFPDGSNDFNAEQGKDFVLTVKRSVDDDRTFSLFEKLLIDEKEVEKTNYTLQKGSVIITLKGEFIKTLSAGEHTVKVVFSDGGVVEHTLTVKAASTSPKTGDSAQIMLYILLAMAALSGLTTVTVLKKKEN